MNLWRGYPISRTLEFTLFLAYKIAITTDWKKPVVALVVMKQKLTWMINEKLVSTLHDTAVRIERVWNP